MTKLTIEELEKAIEHTTSIVNLPSASAVYKQLADTIRENEILYRALEFYARKDIYGNDIMGTLDGVPILTDPTTLKEGGQLARTILSNKDSADV